MVTIKWRFAELPPHKAFDRTVREGRRKVGVRAMKTPAVSAPGHAGRGAVDQKFVKYLSESSNFVKKNANSISFESSE